METNAILAQINDEIARLEKVRALLVTGGGRARKKAPKSTSKKRQLSPEARAKIAAAQKARWAKAKKAAK